MQKFRNVAVNDATWYRIKSSALAERITMREWLERAVYQVGADDLAARFLAPFGPAPKPVDLPTVYSESEKHWPALHARL